MSTLTRMAPNTHENARTALRAACQLVSGMTVARIAKETNLSGSSLYAYLVPSNNAAARKASPTALKSVAALLKGHAEALLRAAERLDTTATALAASEEFDP